MNRFPISTRTRPLLFALMLCLAWAVPAVQKDSATQQLEFGVKVALKGSWNEAAFRFEKSVQANAGNARAWCNLAVARESLGQFDAARQAYEKAIALAPKEQRIRENYDRFQNYMKSTHRGSGAP
ncbi:MAG TPA: tetratricopeptide repeat protein [Patescibacteria group bacterium]|nr:tetratricopeptide repeat protein [Patescibacteria group bacterium]